MSDPHQQLRGDVDLYPYFDIIDESGDYISISSVKRIILVNHTEANRGVTRWHFTLEEIFGFWKAFKKITNGLGSELELETSSRKLVIFFTSR